MNGQRIVQFKHDVLVPSRKQTLFPGQSCVLQKGSAITEFSVSLVVLVPLFLMIPMLGKVSDMNSSTIQASRYGAWERTVTSDAEKSDAQIQIEMENRFFSRIDTTIQSERGELTDDEFINPLWRGYGDDRLLRSAQDDVGSTMSNAATPGSIAGTIDSVITTFTSAISALSDNADFDVNRNGLYTSRVAVDVGANQMGFTGNTNCAGDASADVFSCIRRHNVILTDTWSSESPDQAASRARGLVPMAIFDRVQPVFSAIGNFPLLEELGGFEPGYVLPDVIPADRLGSYEE